MMDADVIDAAISSISMKEAADKVGVHYLTFRKHAKRLGVWNPNPGLKGTRKPSCGRKSPPLSEILEGKHYGYRGCLKRHLLKAGIKENHCEECQLNGEWNGKTLVYELDHINGDSRDHRLANLRMLCPNCHSQTPTFRAKNKSRGAHV